MPTDTLKDVTSQANEFAGIAGTGAPVSSSMYKDLQEQTRASMANWMAASVGEQPTSWFDQQVSPHLSAEVAASNARTAKGLATTTDLTTAAEYLKDALKTGGAQAQLEVKNLLQQLDAIAPGQSEKLATLSGVNFLQSGNGVTTAAAVQSRQPSVGSLKGTTFFGGAGIDGPYIEDMVLALEEAGIKNVRAADRDIWSDGLLMDAASVPFENSRDEEPSDFSKFGKKGEQFNLVGYSYGGLQAAQAALDYAEMGGFVDNVALIGTPIETEFLAQLKEHPKIGNVTVIDLTTQGDSIKAGMSDADVLLSAPHLMVDFIKGVYGPKDGHFYYSDESLIGVTRRRVLANQLKSAGLK